MTVVAAPSVRAQFGVNLLANSGFDTGVLTPWSMASGNALPTPYGAPGAPVVGVSTTILGNGLLLRDVTGGSVVQQVVTPSSMPAGSWLLVSGYCGGGPEDTTRLAIHFRNAAGTTIGIQNSTACTATDRNRETVLLYREVGATVPAGAVSFVVRVEFTNECCNSIDAAADEVSATLFAAPVVPAAWPLGAELLANPGFEGGWSATSPLTLVDPRGWEGSGTTSCSVRPYSNVSPAAPSGTVSCVVSGAFPNPSCGGGAAGNFLGHDGAASALVQRIDLRGNAAQISAGSVNLRVSAFLGGAFNENDAVRVDFECLSSTGVSLATLRLDSVSQAARNYESLLLRRQAEFSIPVATRQLKATVTFENGCCNNLVGWIDNVSASLVAPTALAPLPLGANLIHDSSFENGSVPGSPLQLTDADGWSGNGANRCETVPFGVVGTPSSTFAASHALGGLVLRDTNAGALRQVIDLRGSQALVQTGNMRMQASAWLGGHASETDTAEVRISFENANHVAVGVLQFLPPVTAADRGNVTTLIERISPAFVVPTTAAFAIVNLVFTNNCCNGVWGLADDVRLVAFDATQQVSASPFPGSGGDFVLLTGINQLPTTGFGNYVKIAHGNDVLTTLVGSPNGTLTGAPMLLGLNVFLTGAPPTPVLTDLALDPFNLLVVDYGFAGGSFLPVVLPLSQGGSPGNLLIPPGLSGLSVLLQALCLQLPSVPSPNGRYFTTEGHEVRLQ